MDILADLEKQPFATGKLHLYLFGKVPAGVCISEQSLDFPREAIQFKVNTAHEEMVTG